MRTLSFVALLAFSTLGTAQSPLLTLSGGTNQGNVGGGIYSSGTGLGVVALGFTQLNPGLDLSGIGMPGCRVFGLFDATANIPIAGTSVSFPLSIPNITALNGGLLYGQTITVSPGFNALGLLSSNGVRMRLGSL